MPPCPPVTPALCVRRLSVATHSIAYAVISSDDEQRLERETALLGEVGKCLDREKDERNGIDAVSRPQYRSSQGGTLRWQGLMNR